MTTTSPIKTLCLLGPTATGKTTLAARVAADLDAEIISVDSRQVYRGMDIGTGKDLADYEVDGHTIPYHLIDILDPGEHYNVFDFKKDCIAAMHAIRSRGRLPLLCGGTGLYMSAMVQDYRLPDVPANRASKPQCSPGGLSFIVECRAQGGAATLQGLIRLGGRDFADNHGQSTRC